MSEPTAPTPAPDGQPTPAPAASAPAVAKPAAPPKPAVKPAAPPPPWAFDEKVLCYPNMIFHELVVCLGTLVFIWAWSLFMDAPLEEAANGNLTPNPSRAPWYFLGLQELLVYFDPWIAGVLLPQFIVQGLVILPYVDTNPTQQGYYSYKGRELEFWVMSIGFIMWFVLIIVGSTMRGPSWQMYMPWESWLTHKPPAAETWSLDDHTKVYLMGMKIPVLGILALGGYFGVGMAIPMLLFKEWYKEKGFLKYNLIVSHLLVMLAVPIKMALRLGLDIKYIFTLTTPLGSINI